MQCLAMNQATGGHGVGRWLSMGLLGPTVWLESEGAV